MYCFNLTDFVCLFEKLSLAAVVESWYDGFDSPSLIACAPDSYLFLDQARPRSCASNLSTNHGGVCLLYRKELHARRIDMPKYRSVELICALVTGCGLKLLVAVIYRPGSKATDMTSLTISLTSLSVCPISRHLWLLVISTSTLTFVSLSTLLNSIHY